MHVALSILWAAMRSVIKIFLTSLPGAIMYALGYIKRDTIGGLAKLLHYVLFPCLIFYKISVGISVESLKIAWPLVLYPSLQCIFGFLFAKFLSVVLGVSRGPLEKVLTVTLMFSNYGNLPYMVIDSITTEIEPYSKDPTALSRGLAYSSLFLFTSSAWMWSFGPYYMSRGSRSVPVQSLDEITSNNNSFVRSRSSSSCSEAFLPDVSKNCAASDSFSVSARQTLNSSPALQQVVVPLEQLHIPVQKDEEPSSSTSSCNFETLDGTYLCQTPLQASPICPGSDDQFLQQPPNTFSKFKEKICHFFRSTFQLLRKLVSPSTISCILAISIVLINPVHRALFHDVPSMISNPSRPALQPTSIPTPDGDSAPPPLKFIADVIEILGDASIPLSLTILGSSLYQTLKPSSTSTSYSVSPSAAQLTHRLSPRAIIAIAVAAKLLFMPIFAFSVAYLLSLVGLSIRDSLVFLVLTIEGSSPSAINLIVLIQITNSQDVMQTISFIIFFQYLFAMITMPLVVLTSVSIFG